MRSATAPEMSAGVIAANMPRKATVESVKPPSSPVIAMSRRNAASKLPISEPMAPPVSGSFWNGTCASENPTTTQTIGTIKMQ
ncbi:unannotated protein [freshwater metagenome]|uniref:Unannotated protein n=1 Tax=freshwater metagenome TaxID=449393 RepID=A0A6J6D8Z9_9ZZZZ